MLQLVSPELTALLTLWQTRLGANGLPLATDLDPTELRPWLDHIVIMDAVPEGDFAYAYYGRAFAVSFGENRLGQTLARLPEAQRRILAAEYERVRLARAPAARTYRAPFDGVECTWERLVLPLTGDGQTVDKLLVAAYRLDEAAAAEAEPSGEAAAFNGWCALNSAPFNLIAHAWPDGLVEWDIVWQPGTPAERVVYGTGQQDERAAVIAAFAFLAGAEWGALEGPGAVERDEGAPGDPSAPGAASGAATVTSAELAQLLSSGANEDASPPDTAPGYRLPALSLLQAPPEREEPAMDEQSLAQNARQLETVLKNFRVRGEIMEVKPGPVVTLYEFEPAPGTKSSTVINLTEDIARSMSAVTARIAIVPGRSVIGVELPNPVRQMVYLREMLEMPQFQATLQPGNPWRLPIVLGKDIAGEPIIADLARMPHLLIAGTTGSGKSVGINTMILSLLWRLPPERCRFIMVDPKMLELSVYDDIPHLLTPVVTDSRKAVSALRWAVREMESRYEAMARLGVRNIESYNQRIEEMLRRGEPLHRRVQVGFNRDTREPEYEEQEIEPVTLPYIVVVVDEFADLMLVAGKDIEWAIQRLAQMARAAGLHLIMATQRPSVDVITGTIKANFPTRISFMVTSKIDSRTILGESGAEQLLGQGDMLYMTGGGRITRVHGPFVSDSEVEDVVAFIKQQGQPDYVHAVTEEDDDVPVDEPGEAPAPFQGSGDDLYDQALALVARERRVSISSIQRHFQIGYNRAARLVERMESEGAVSPPDHKQQRQILVAGRRE